MNNKDLILHYFELSNAGNIDAISQLLDEQVSYSSDNVGLHFWKENIINMKNTFFWWLKSQNWKIETIEEVSENIFKIHFLFSAETLDWESISRPWVESVIVHEWKLRHIEVRNI